jgi:hypothetical protein
MDTLFQRRSAHGYHHLTARQRSFITTSSTVIKILETSEINGERGAILAIVLGKYEHNKLQATVPGKVTYNGWLMPIS